MRQIKFLGILLGVVLTLAVVIGLGVGFDRDRINKVFFPDACQKIGYDRMVKETLIHEKDHTEELGWACQYRSRVNPNVNYIFPLDYAQEAWAKIAREKPMQSIKGDK